jgi:hypothetical protein
MLQRDPATGAVGRVLDLVAFLAEAADEEVGDPRLVFDDQNAAAHATLSCREFIEPRRATGAESLIVPA